uniref:NADH-ubiquinone oxidoreductase chain 6 n=1 Tax=Hydractinia polyclina TaxID=589945 RepID=A0A0S4M1N9_9CNID|nr:TPA: NADH dehydrogenase subunit 6 [Hydractinia polyclina]
MEQLYFLFSFFLIISVIMVINSLNPIHSVFWLVLVFINSSGFLITMGFEFIALMMIIIYVGAIAILFLFVIMMLDIIQINKPTTINNILPILFIISLNILLESWWLFKYNIFKVFYERITQEINLEILTHVHVLGQNLYSNFAFPFLIISLLLLVAMVGAIVLTLELNQLTRKQVLVKQHQRNNSWI